MLEETKVREIKTNISAQIEHFNIESGHSRNGQQRNYPEIY